MFFLLCERAHILHAFYTQKDKIQENFYTHIIHQKKNEPMYQLQEEVYIHWTYIFYKQVYHLKT